MRCRVTRKHSLFLHLALESLRHLGTLMGSAAVPKPAADAFTSAGLCLKILCQRLGVVADDNNLHTALVITLNMSYQCNLSGLLLCKSTVHLVINRSWQQKCAWLDHELPEASVPERLGSYCDVGMVQPGHPG